MTFFTAIYFVLLDIHIWNYRYITKTTFSHIYYLIKRKYQNHRCYTFERKNWEEFPIGNVGRDLLVTHMRGSCLPVFFTELSQII